MKPKNYRRGYPVAVLIGIEQNHVAIWQIYSQVAKHQETLQLIGERRDQKALYNFHETIINTIRSTLKQGVKNLLIASAPKTSYAQDFKTHITAHHNWMLQGPNKSSISVIVSLASTPQQVAALTKKSEFKNLIQTSAAEETENLLETLEKRLNTNSDLVLFSLEEAEIKILQTQPPGKPHPEYLLLTNAYLAANRRKSRLNRLMQIAQNKKIQTRVIDAESNAGARLTQLGGIICLLKPQ